jgi:hypothetical protein
VTFGDAYIVKHRFRRREAAGTEQAKESSPHCAQHGRLEEDDQSWRDRHNGLASLMERVEQKDAHGEEETEEETEGGTKERNTPHRAWLALSSEHFRAVGDARHHDDPLVGNAELA